MFVNDIRYMESANQYLRLYFDSITSFCLLPLSLDIAASRLPADMFCRIHRQYLISICHVKKFNLNRTRVCMSNDVWLPVGRSYRHRLLEHFCFLKQRYLRLQELLFTAPKWSFTREFLSFTQFFKVEVWVCVSLYGQSLQGAASGEGERRPLIHPNNDRRKKTIF